MLITGVCDTCWPFGFLGNPKNQKIKKKPKLLSLYFPRYFFCFGNLFMFWNTFWLFVFFGNPTTRKIKQNVFLFFFMVPGMYFSTFCFFLGGKPTLRKSQNQKENMIVFLSCWVFGKHKKPKHQKCFFFFFLVAYFLFLFGFLLNFWDTF